MENAERLEILKNKPFGIFHSKVFEKKIDFTEEFKDGMLGDIILAHDGSYILNIKKVCEEIPSGALYNLDGDTSLSCESWPASIRAVGAVIEACK